MEAKEYVTLTNSASKRALFPINRCTKSGKSDDEDSLGHMSPLKDLSSPDRYSSPPHSPCWVAETPVKSMGCEEFKENLGSPSRAQRVRRLLQSSPQHVLADIVNSTPMKEDENEMMSSFECLVKLKHIDNCSYKFGRDFTPLRDLIKRKNIEETPDSITSKADAAEKVRWKRKLQARSPEIKSDSKKDIDLSSSVVSLIKNSFYKPSESKAKASLFTGFMAAKKQVSSKVVEKSKARNLNATYPGSYSRNGNKRRVSLREMNAGVRHKVRRPKPRKISLGNIKKSTEVPLISPEQRVLEYLKENKPIERSTPVKRPRLNEDSVNLTSDSIDMNIVDHDHSDIENSPEELVPDPNKKFFKTNRTMAIDHKAVVTVVNNVKIKVHKGKMALVSLPRQMTRMKKRRSFVQEKPFEEDNCVQQEMEQVKGSVEEVIEKLNNELESPQKSHDFQSLLSHDVETGDNCHQIQSLTSSTSSLALNDFEDVHTNEFVDANIAKDSFATVEPVCPESDTAKLYPVFHKRKGLYDSIECVTKKISPPKKIRPLGENQLQIDAGQSRFKAVHCKECGTLYHLGDPEDEIAHYNIHNNISTFRFAGWKNERVVRAYPDGGKVIVVYPDDPKPWVNKIKIVLDTVDQEMGFVDGHSCGVVSEKVYFYVLKSRIVGVLAAQIVNNGFKMLDTGVDGPDCCSEETYPVKCGISRIWVASDQRRKGIATSLMDCVRLTFMFDHILAKTEIAFSVPTELGKAFASHYMHTKEFMVYYK